jgi:hypothetical protein
MIISRGQHCNLEVFRREWLWSRSWKVQEWDLRNNNDAQKWCDDWTKVSQHVLSLHRHDPRPHLLEDPLLRFRK